MQFQEDLTKYFNQMEQLSNNKGSVKISSRIRFMLQDVIDLRKTNWVPRRNDVKPKTIGQIKKEVESERIIGQYASSMASTPRKEERGADRKRNREFLVQEL